MIIKYNNNTIYDWNFGASNIIKVYRNNAVVYYKIDTSGDTPTYKVCYAVVYDISQYSETEFVDVYDKTTEKWYKLNNLNQYEEYGVYGSSTGASVTTYDGKLAIVDGYEYQYSGNSWVNVGEVSGSSRVPSEYTEVEYVENSSSAYINTNLVLYEVENSFEIKVRTYFTPYSNDFEYLFGTEGTSSPYVGLQFRYYKKTLQYNSEGDTINWAHVDNGDGTSGVTASCSSVTATNGNNPLTLFCGLWSSGAWRFGRGKIYSFVVTKNNSIVRDLVPCTRNSDSKVGMYDVINDVFYYSPNSYQLTAGDEASHITYPIYYDTKSDPLNNLSFSSITEADTYAYNNCVYDGMIATIDGDRYSFDSDEGWVLVPYYYRVEDVTSSSYGGSGWTVTDSDTYNPNKAYYDDYSVEQTSTSYQYKVAKVTIFGYDNFTYYLRTSGYSNYAYAVATNIDELQSDPTSMSYRNSRAITNTYNWNKTPKADVNLSNYRRVTYNNLDKTVEHTFYVIFYGRKYSSYDSTATLLIPKDQSQENWEQVTFSSSTNVSGSTKTLSIDGNSSTSGGTSYFYNRWMIGLPSGSHTSYVSYSNYEYCPSVTSSTFTSVDGGVREVDYSYANATNKTLQFRLVDESGNTITTADTVYYNMFFNNGCGVSTSSSNLTFPRSQNVKVGGYFYFINSSNRHYIYGYTPNIQMNTNYYSDNYSTYFDIPYTKLDEEAVTITYTTYDPSDSETPTFETKVSYPYGNSGSTTFSTTSYNVPYTYSYVVSQTNNLFSADSQSFTASESARTISFTLYPNNREFSTVADMEAYAYAWEGMIAYVDDTTYKYENGEWFERFIPYTYEELSYFTVPKVLCTSSNYFAIKNNLNSNYIYTYQFTPNNGFYDSYYGCITSNDNHNVFKNYGIFKLDNGWGTESERSILALYNYKFDTRRSSDGGNIPRAFRFYINTKATVIMKLHNPSDTTQGADLTVQNDGYTTVTETSTTLLNSSLTVVEGEYDMPLFSTTSNNYYTPQISFHNFKVEDNDGNLIYDYRPVKRILDGTIGLYDTVNQQFFYPSGYTFTT